MFSSENNNYPLFYDHSPSLANNNVIPENNSNLFQHHHGIHGYILPFPPTFSSIQDNHIAKLSIEPSIYHQQNSILYPSNMITSRSRRAPGKKDRHTKISTAQGVRDRRVRLSISIARDFFNLQDMLGFDKASTTVGWLMAKSKAAINELTSTSNKKNEEKNIEDTNVDDGGGVKEAIDVKSCTNKKRNRRNSFNNLNATMEMKRREEARNRARERTRNKKLGGGGGGCDDMNQLQQQHQSVQPQDLMIFQSSSGTSTNGVISNRISSKDDQESCNYNNDYFNKFTSESSNYGGIPGLNIINMSEIHINDISWDNFNNQFPH